MQCVKGYLAAGMSKIGNEGVNLAPFNKMATKIPDALKKELEQVRQDLMCGKIKIGVELLK